MAQSRKNEIKTDIDLFNYLSNDRVFSSVWELRKTSNVNIQEVLDHSSKSETGNRGEPDLIYVNDAKKLLILIENKNSIKNHISKNLDNPKIYAVDGVIHYLKQFLNFQGFEIKESTKKYLKDWHIIGIAFSGGIRDQYNHLVSSFVIAENSIVDIETNEFLDEEDYVSLFENIDLEFVTKNISKSSREINRMLRAIDSQKRPILLSALMICLYKKYNVINDFKDNYNSWGINTIVRNIPTTIKDVLISEGIDREKIDVLTNELSFIKTDNDLNSTGILKDILVEIENNVIPLFNKNSNYDIIGKFYEEFLRYAGVTNVKKGIVLTPNHITNLFADLIDIRINDVILDTCCGTGAFLISGMNKLISEIEHSSIQNKRERINSIKYNQLIGFEKSSTMYSLAISNMLVRGDGKSRIYNVDSFSTEAKDILKNLEREGVKPTIGFINPPYGGRDNKSNPTKKEIQFIEVMLDNVGRYGVVIAPLSTFFKDETERNRILSKHTLKCVLNMPNELFQPNAATHTAIAVFETNLPHNGKEVLLMNLEDDGYVLSKNKGRTDVYNKWKGIKKDLLRKVSLPIHYQDSISLIYKNISTNDEWIIQAHSKKDYTFLNEVLFRNTIKEYFAFKVKKELNLINKSIDELTFFEILLGNYEDVIQESRDFSSNNELADINWKEFNLIEIFGENNVTRGMRLIESDRQPGEVLYYSASDYNNGLTDSISNPLFVEKDALIYTTFGKCYYVEGEFTASDEISIFKSDNLNLYNGLFLATVITNNRYKYTFGRKAFHNKFSRDKIYLPVTDEGKPDWDFMENYIKSLPYSSAI